MKKILAAIDFLDPTDDVIDFVKEFASQIKAELLILHTEVVESYINTIVTEFHQQPSLELIEQRKAQLKTKMDSIHKELTEAGVEVTCRLVEGPTVQTILQEAEDFCAELIVIGSHKHGAFYHLLLGSLHESLISHSVTPVLVIPPKSQEKEK